MAVRRSGLMPGVRGQGMAGQSISLDWFRVLVLPAERCAAPEEAVRRWQIILPHHGRESQWQGNVTLYRPGWREVQCSGGWNSLSLDSLGK